MEASGTEPANYLLGYAEPAVRWLLEPAVLAMLGIGSVLLTEFVERLSAQGVRVVSTGFFRPSFFSKHGFGVDPRYAGIVRFLQPDPETDEK